MQFQYVMYNKKALIHLNYQWLHSLQSSIPFNKTCKKWDMTLSSSMAMYSVMRDILWCKNDTYGKKISCSLHTSHIQILKWIDFRTMGLWIWITFFWYALYKHVFFFTRMRMGILVKNLLPISWCKFQIEIEYSRPFSHKITKPERA